MEMLSNQPHLLGSASTPLPGVLLVTKGKANQLWGNSWGSWKLRGPPWHSSGLILSFVQLKKKSTYRAIHERLREAVPSGSFHAPAVGAKHTDNTG